MSEAEEKKLEAAERRDRKDAERKDGQDEEIPAWADALLKSHKDMAERLDAMERKDRKDSERDFGEDPEENTDGQKKDESEEERHEREAEGGRKANEEERGERKEKEREDEERRPLEAADRKDRKDRKDTEGDTDEDTDREDRARKDAAHMAENRRLRAKLEEMEHQVKALYREPSIDDRNGLAEARSRADSLYQAVLGRPCPEPLPGERPIAYRKRLADGLKKFSETFKNERLDSLTGATYDTVEERIYADAASAIRSEAIVPAGTLRAIQRQELGHNVTEYVGDPTAAWAPFMAGTGGIVRINRPTNTH